MRARRKEKPSLNDAANLQNELLVLCCAHEVPVQRPAALRALQCGTSFRYNIAKGAYSFSHYSDAKLKVGPSPCLAAAVGHGLSVVPPPACGPQLILSFLRAHTNS